MTLHVATAVVDLILPRLAATMGRSILLVSALGALPLSKDQHRDAQPSPFALLPLQLAAVLGWNSAHLLSPAAQPGDLVGAAASGLAAVAVNTIVLHLAAQPPPPALPPLYPARPATTHRPVLPSRSEEVVGSATASAHCLAA